MSTSYPPPGPAGDAENPRGAPFLARVRRSRTSRRVAGVCGGLGEALGIDPLVLRVGIVILTIFAGVGLLLYALAWLLVAEEGADESLGERLIHGRGGSAAIVPIVGVVVGLVAFGHGIGSGSTGVVVVVTLLALGIAVALSDDRPLVAPAPPPVPPTPGQASAAGETDPYGRSAGTAYSAPAAPPSGAPSGPGFAPPAAPPPAWPPYPRSHAPRPPRPPRPPAMPLTLLTLTAAVAVAALAVLVAHALGASVGFSFTVGTGLVVVGVGTAVSTVWGRAGALPLVGALLALVLLAHGAAQDAFGSRDWRQWGDATVRPTSLADVATPLEHGVGQFTVDLRSLPLSGQRVTVRVRNGVGALRILVPSNVALDATARVRVGELTLPGQQPSNGGHVSGHVVDATGAQNGTVVLDVDEVIGNVEVQR